MESKKGEESELTLRNSAISYSCVLSLTTHWFTCSCSDHCQKLGSLRIPILENFLGAISLYIVNIPCVCVCVCVRARARSVTQSCLTLCDPMACSAQGSSDHGIFQASIPEQVAQGIFLTQGSNLYLLRWQVDSLPLASLGKASYKFLKFESLYVSVKNKIWRVY